MSSIPNLNTLRKGAPRSRGRRGVSILPKDEAVSKDNIVQQTDNDAASSRLSAVELGYLHDQYAKELSTITEPPRRYPLINRGTYVRTAAIDRLMKQFLSLTSANKQVISLGAGSDTRYFRLCASVGKVAYHEIDFEVNTAIKKASIERSTLLRTRRQELEAQGCVLHLHSTDLRDLRPESTTLAGLDVDAPTLILSECCLCYLAPEEASATLAYFKQHLRGSMTVVLYEPIRPGDAFGRTMVANLASRGIHMQTLKRYASLEAQRQRLRMAGFDTLQGARDVFQIWQDPDWTPEAEHERIERLEWLDEVEEWKLLASHYCVAWACRGDDVKAAWADIDGITTSEELSADRND